ncbi:anhydro-N-acetylmuramic acid kinase [Spirochaetia bacterium]|nr:anhydro-N-acetylmuramic acid kinase [Spirochaetia bacterium]
MKQIIDITDKDPRLAIGLMSGTSLDGMDAALVEISGSGTDTRYKLLGFETIPYSDEVKQELLKSVMGDYGGSRVMLYLNSLIGEISLEACRLVCEKAGVNPDTIDFVGSHGQTVYHEPLAVPFAGKTVRGTLQAGEASIISEGLLCPVVSDFRVRDMAAGGQGAPLVPYVDYLLYRSGERTTALQNIGGIGNVTLLSAGCTLDQVLAFDTGPGNMIIDAVMEYFYRGKLHYDKNGKVAGTGTVDKQLLEYMHSEDAEYLEKSPPKSTGREKYNADYVKRLLKKADALSIDIKNINIKNIDIKNIVATVTRYTALTIGESMRKFGSLEQKKTAPAEKPRFIINGGGARNSTLVSFIKEELTGWEVLTGDEAGINTDAKEAVAFAILANEALHGKANNAPSATGAKHPVVMGKITI